MKTILAAAALALSMFATQAAADDVAAPTIIVIEATDVADAQQQMNAVQKDVGSTGVIFIVQQQNADSGNTLQKDVGSTGVIF